MAEHDGYCDHDACKAAYFGVGPVSAMSPEKAAQILAGLRGMNRGESWVSAVLASHVRHVS